MLGKDFSSLHWKKEAVGFYHYSYKMYVWLSDESWYKEVSFFSLMLSFL